METARNLSKLRTHYPMMTISELASRIGRSAPWVAEIMSMTQLTKEIQDKIDSGAISLLKGYYLAQLSHDDQKLFAADAETMVASLFVTKVREHLAKLQESIKCLIVEAVKEQLPKDDYSILRDVFG